MPRAKLYFTREERQSAARKASATYYQKHKDTIQRKRKEIRDSKKKEDALEENETRYKGGKRQPQSSKPRKKESKDVSSASETGEKNDKRSGKQNSTMGNRGLGPTPLARTPQAIGEKWLEYAMKLHRKVQAYYGPEGSHKKFCDVVVKTYMSDYHRMMANSLDRVVDHHNAFEKFVSRFQKYEGHILNSVGAGEIYDKVVDMKQNAFLTVSALSDIYCEATLGFHHLVLHHELRRFSWQRKTRKQSESCV
ncbi:hypothetical protein V5O48_006861 [Marasmius crinis-equi]|uniref:Uncharacterized protein n=1 Tax=Marasmius crinis-equi TaxID=585013 RepID=A0ABR3FIK3_9AGAR